MGNCLGPQSRTSDSNSKIVTHLKLAKETHCEPIRYPPSPIYHTTPLIFDGLSLRPKLQKGCAQSRGPLHKVVQCIFTRMKEVQSMAKPLARILGPFNVQVQSISMKCMHWSSSIRRSATACIR